MTSVFKRIIILFLATLVFSTAVFAEGQKELVVEKPSSKMTVLGESDTTVTFREPNGNIVELPKNPERPIICLNSIMDVWYMAGGKSLARVRGSVNVPEEAEELPQIGSVGSLNTELIMELEPDFLIFTVSDVQSKVRKLFTAEGVPCVTIKYKNYEDFRVILDLFTRLNNTRNIYDNMAVPTEKKVQHIIDQVPETNTPPTVCILFASTKYVKVETQNTITGYMCKKLGTRNIYIDDTIEGATRVELSLEYITEQDPDIIFVTTMGDVDKCKARIQKDIVSNDIWGELSAVKNDRFIYLDKSYSLYKPNRFYPEAFQIMAEFIYPGIEFTHLPDKE